MIMLIINPRLVLQKHDTFTTGIVYMPFLLAYLSGYLKSKNIEFTILDCFGEAPEQWTEKSYGYTRGLSDNCIADGIHRFRQQSNSKLVVIYAINASYHKDILTIIKITKKSFPEARIIVAENSQAVTAYSIREVKEEFFLAGANELIEGDLEDKVQKIAESTIQKNSLDERDNLKNSQQYNDLEFEKYDWYADWSQFPLENYWKLNYAHGPVTNKKYLPILTSRGCPYPCTFCVIPSTNKRRWRAKDSESVVAEIKYLSDLHGLTEFHIEDVNSTIDDQRTRKICKEIIKQNLKVQWKLVSGTKVESIKDRETIRLAAKAGCTYISISPESGSKRIMKKIKKPFNYRHAVEIIEEMNNQKINSQACFVIGFPGENLQDQMMTWKMVRDITIAGVSEIAVFIISPMPGAEIYESIAHDNNAVYSFSPNWRADYQSLKQFRDILYMTYIALRIYHYPLRSIKHLMNILRGQYESKSEMVVVRGIKNKLRIVQNQLRRPE